MSGRRWHDDRWLLSAGCLLAASQRRRRRTGPTGRSSSSARRPPAAAPTCIGRLVADQLSARIGQPIVYENRPGGGNKIGTEAAARSAPDGYTFFFATAAALVTDPYTFKSLPYDPMKDFTVVSNIAEVSFMVLAHPDVPAKNLAELFAYAKANPAKLAIATDGARRFSGMIAAWLNKLAGTQISYVPYTQMTQGVQDVLDRPRPAHGHRRAGRARPCRERQASRRSPSPRRSGCRISPTCRRSPRRFRASTSPAGSCWRRRPACPTPILTRVNREMAAIMTDPAVVKKLGDIGYISHGGGTLERDARLRAGAARRLGHAGAGDRPAAGVTLQARRGAG